MSGAGWKRGPRASIISRCRMTMHTSRTPELWRRFARAAGARDKPWRILRTFATAAYDKIYRPNSERETAARKISAHRSLSVWICGQGRRTGCGPRGCQYPHRASYLKVANTRDVANCRPKHKHLPSGNSLDRSERLRSGALLPPCSDLKRTAAFGSSSRDRLRLSGAQSCR